MGVERVRTPSAYFFDPFFLRGKKGYTTLARLCGINSTAQTHKKQNRVLLPRFSPKEKRAAMCRSNFRGRVSKNNKYLVLFFTKNRAFLFFAYFLAFSGNNIHILLSILCTPFQKKEKNSYADTDNCRRT